MNNYINTVACETNKVQLNHIVVIDPPQEGYTGSTYYVLWNGDKGCADGSDIHSNYISEVAKYSSGWLLGGKLSEHNKIHEYYDKCEKVLQARRSQLLEQFSRAKMNDDEEALSEVWDEIEKFNAKNPSCRITKPNAMQSYRNRMRRINDSESGVYISKKHHEILDERRFSFSE